MTGSYNNRNYIRFGLLDLRATTFAHLPKKAGYATCIVGKRQLSGGSDAMISCQLFSPGRLPRGGTLQ